MAGPRGDRARLRRRASCPRLTWLDLAGALLAALVIGLPMLVTRDGFGLDYPNQVWLVWAQGKSLGAHGFPAYFLNAPEAGGVFTAVRVLRRDAVLRLGAVSALLGDRALVAFTLASLLCIGGRATGRRAADRCRDRRRGLRPWARTAGARRRPGGGDGDLDRAMPVAVVVPNTHSPAHYDDVRDALVSATVPPTPGTTRAPTWYRAAPVVPATGRRRLAFDPAAMGGNRVTVTPPEGPEPFTAVLRRPANALTGPVRVTLEADGPAPTAGLIVSALGLLGTLAFFAIAVARRR